MGPIVVIGVAGFVGQHLARFLRQQGWDVRGATSRRNQFLLDHLGIQDAGTERYPYLINLAYPTAPVPLGRRKDNAEIVDRVSGLVQPGAKIIHVSSLAVFGFGLDRPQQTDRLRWRPDQDYVESKVWMENQLVDELGGRHAIEVVRLGNVWGPGSPGWLCGTAKRLQEGLPTLVEGGRYSNVTEVGNVISYLDFLARRASQTSERVGVRFHHLGEFSEQPWETFVNPIAQRLGVESVRCSRPAPSSVKSFLFGKMAGEVFRFLHHRRLAGSVVRQVLERLPESAVKGLRREKNVALGSAGMDDPILAEVLGCDRQFRTQVDPEWRAPIDLPASLDRALTWLETAGFVRASKQSV